MSEVVLADSHPASIDGLWAAGTGRTHMAPLAKPFPCLARPRNSESASELFPGQVGGK